MGANHLAAVQIAAGHQEPTIPLFISFIGNIGSMVLVYTVFILTTLVYSLVNDPRYQHLIEWDTNGVSFLVRNVMEFSREVLPKHFKHSNFSSFIRQLNMQVFKVDRVV